MDEYAVHGNCLVFAHFTSERWTLMELQRLDNVLVWQSEYGCACPDPRDLTTAIGSGHRSRGYILKGSLGLPTTKKHAFFLCKVCGKQRDQ